ncbi:MAG: hypothetical protein ABW133_22645 [Polyangiaceae bacterium]
MLRTAIRDQSPRDREDVDANARDSRNSDPPIEGITATARDGWLDSRAFFRVRVSILLTILAGVLIWAGCDIHRRHARTQWVDTLDVALILVRKDNLDDGAVEMLKRRTTALEERLAAEFHRRNPDAPKPFHFVVPDPVDLRVPPPKQPSEGLFDLARYNFDLWRFARGVNGDAGVEASRFDATIYIVARSPKASAGASVEGASQEGGTVGVVEVELDRSMVDFALFVTTHELLHLLGARDKYDAEGRSLVPEGLAEPELRPLYPQRHAEVMARNVALSPTEERPPESLSDLKVGPATAREIGWVR